MAKNKKSWLNPSRSPSDMPAKNGYSAPPPPSDSGDTGMWARSEPPPAFESRGDDEPSYGYDQPAKYSPLGSTTQTSPFSSPALPKVEEPMPAEPAKSEPPSSDSAPVATTSETSTDASMAASTAAEPGEQTTTIGPTIIIRGKLVSHENLVVRGRIEAEITSSKDLHLEQSGIINADMRVKSVTICGIVVGDIHAQERVKLAPEARVVGDIYTPRLVVEDGATFRGRIEMEGLTDLEGVRPVTAPRTTTLVPDEPDASDASAEAAASDGEAVAADEPSEAVYDDQY